MGMYRWSLVLDFGEALRIAEVHIAWHEGHPHQATFSLDTSLDGTAWSGNMQRESSGTSTTFEVYPFPEAVHARYVRMTGMGNSVSAWNPILEVVAHGFAHPAGG
jgi:hypothetical protein